MARRKNVRFAAIQTRVAQNKLRNINRAKKLVEKAATKHNADIVGLPELFTTPFFPFYRDKRYLKLAEPIPGPTTAEIARVAEEFGIFIIAPIFEHSGNRYFDSSPILSPSGRIVANHRKCSIPEASWASDNVVNHEKFYFTPGNDFQVADLGICKLGQLICYDRHFPEAWRLLQQRGAEIVYVPNASVGKTMAEMFPLESRAMCFTNQVFGVVSNRIGSQDKFWFFGKTHMVHPSGKLVAGPLNRPNDIVYAELELVQVEKIRRDVAFLRDRRRDLYGAIAK